MRVSYVTVENAIPTHPSPPSPPIPLSHGRLDDAVGRVEHASAFTYVPAGRLDDAVGRVEHASGALHASVLLHSLHHLGRDGIISQDVSIRLQGKCPQILNTWANVRACIFLHYIIDFHTKSWV